MVIARGNIGNQRPEGIKRGVISPGLGVLVVDLHLVQWNVAWAFDHHLHVVFPGTLGQLADGLQLRKLRGVVGISNGTRA